MSDDLQVLMKELDTKLWMREVFNINTPCTKGWTPIQMSMLLGDEEIFSALVQQHGRNGVDVLNCKMPTQIAPSNEEKLPSGVSGLAPLHLAAALGMNLDRFKSCE